MVYSGVIEGFDLTVWYVLEVLCTRVTMYKRCMSFPGLINDATRSMAECEFLSESGRTVCFDGSSFSNNHRKRDNAKMPHHVYEVKSTSRTRRLARLVYRPRSFRREHLLWF